MNWPAPAKLNLFLHIVGRRADGYHQLQTVFQFLDFGDELSFEMRPDGRIRRIGELDGVPAAEDLTVRAAQALQRAAGARLGCDIRIDKRIPLGGGLGGGSSDAATTLVALDRLWQLSLGDDALATIGLEIGADVPVFVRGFAAWAEGVGEKLTPIQPLEPWYLVVTPPVAVSTREIFQAPELPRSSAPVTRADFEAGRCRNDCEALVLRRYPPIADAADWLRELAPEVRLSGTGASVFAAFPRRDDALQAQAGAPPGCRSFVARGLNRSPLKAAADGYNPRAKLG